MLDGQLLFLLALLAGLVAVAFWRGGAPLVERGLGNGALLLVRFGLLIAVSFLAAGVAEVLVPHAWVRGALGADSGLRGLMIGTAAGALTPAGPFVSMPIAAALLRSGAALPPVVAFLTGWSLLSLHRLVAWEMPNLGVRFSLVRFAVSLLLPLAAGLAARAFTR
jgi:uncharacterized membrane protein YraQ (UPF0718 family)